MEHRIIRVRRQTPARVIATGDLRCGAAAVDITPHLGLPMAGYASSGKVASSLHRRLYARVLVLEDAQGSRAALCHLDMMCASRYLLERSAALAAPVSGIGVDRLILTGTHTHTGPGLFYGNTLYDHFASARSGFDQGFADWISRRVAEGIKQAVERLTPARVGYASLPLWGVSRNASTEAFLANPEATQWWDSGFPGHGAPSELGVRYRAVDPRLRVLVAIDRRDETLIGVSASFGLHCTSLGSQFAGYHPDWAGVAVAHAESALRRQGCGQPVVAVTPSAAGDANALRYDTPQGPRLAQQVGEAVGDALVEAIDKARINASAELDVDVRYTEVDWMTAPPAPDAPELRLAPGWSFGGATLAGGEDGRTWLYRYGLVSLGNQGSFFPTDHPQHPKMPALGRVQGWYAGYFGLEPSRVWPMHVLRIGPHLWATLPGEPTAVMAWRIEQALLQETEATSACVLGYAGDYGGYLTTEEEYTVQHYEGASTLLGRFCGAYIGHQLVAVASGAQEATRPDSEALFVTGQRVELFVDKSIGPVSVAEHVQCTREGCRVQVQFRLESRAVLTFAQGPLVHIETDAGTRWKPVHWQGLELTDVTLPMVVARRRSPFGDGWTITFELPDGLDVSGALRLRVAQLGRFAGFRVRIPPG